MNYAPSSGRTLTSLLAFCIVSQAVFAGGDHHMHIHSADGPAIWIAMCDTMPDDCDDEPAPTGALPAADAIRALDEAGLSKGAILSSAYYYGLPELTGSEFDDHRRVRAENEYVATQVNMYPDRLAGFFSVNPLKEYAISEVSYWAEKGNLAGLKLHFTNSGVDLVDAADMQKLREVIGVLNDHSLAALIHLRSLDPHYGYEHAAQFIEKVARHAPNVTFQLAHMGGWGGFDQGTDGAIQAFLDAIERGHLDRSGVWFDLAAVTDEETTPENCRKLRMRVAEIGFDRVLFASDWDGYQPKTYMETARKCLRLGDDEWRQIMDNQAPYFR